MISSGLAQSRSDALNNYFPYLVLACLLCGTAAFQLWLWPFITDDAYISFRYTARWCDGLGLTFNDGERVEGFSNPLWTFFIGLPCLWGGDLVSFSRLSGAIFSCLTLLGLWCAACAINRPWHKQFAIWALILVLFNAGFQVYASLGMEVPQLAAFLTWAMAFTLLGLQRSRGYLYCAALLMGLVSVSRPEGPLYAALWGLGLAIYYQPWRAIQNFGLLARLAVLVCAPFLAYLSFRWSFYGAWLPNTALAKSATFSHRDFIGFLAILAPLGLTAIFILVLGSLKQLFASDRREVLVSLMLAGLGISIAGLIFTWYGRDDWMAFVRFLQPAYPVLCFILLGIFFLQFESVRPSIQRFLLLCIVGVAGLSNAMALWPWVRVETLAALVMQNTKPTAVALAIHELFPEPRLLAAGRIGALAYYNPQHRILDLFGLTNRAQALAIRASGLPAALFAHQLQDNPVLVQQPEILLVVRSAPRIGLEAYNDQELAYLQPRWRCILRFTQGYWGTYDVWLRHDIRSDIPAQCQEMTDPEDWLAARKRKGAQ